MSHHTMKYKDLGFLIPTLQNDPVSNNILQTISSFINNRPFNQIVVFNSYCELIDSKNIPILNINQAKFFYGNIITFNEEDLFFATKLINANKLFYYAINIPWEKNRKPINYWKSLFMSDNIDIISSNQEIDDLYSIVWRKPVTMVENFDYDKLSEIL